MSRRKSTLPNQEALIVPLLLAILQEGGSLIFSMQSNRLESILGEVFSLTEEQMQEKTPSGAPHWKNTLQWVKKKSIERKFVRGDIRDYWRVSKEGRRWAAQEVLRVYDELGVKAAKEHISDSSIVVLAFAAMAPEAWAKMEAQYNFKNVLQDALEEAATEALNMWKVAYETLDTAYP